MRDERSVIIGCDDLDMLSTVLISLRENSPFPLNLISAARESDLINIAKSLSPSLVILCFSDNQSAIRNFDFYVSQSGIPILCLTRSFEEELQCWSDQSVVFTYPLQHITNKDCLGARIRSFFMLKKETENTAFVASPTEPDKLAESGHERNISRYVMELEQKKEVLLKVKERIVELFPSVDGSTRTELVSIVNSIKLTSSDERIWEDFKVYFEKIDPNFISSLEQKHPTLTSRDLKYCCYLKMNMSNDDIRNLLGINQESVRTHKYRLKKKMALSKEQDLRQYVRSVGHGDAMLVDI